MDEFEARRKVARATWLFFEWLSTEHSLQYAELFESFNVALVFRLAGYGGKETLLGVVEREKIDLSETPGKELEEKGSRTTVNDLIAYIVEVKP